MTTRRPSFHQSVVETCLGEIEKDELSLAQTIQRLFKLVERGERDFETLKTAALSYARGNGIELHDHEVG